MVKGRLPTLTLGRMGPAAPAAHAPEEIFSIRAVVEIAGVRER